MAKYFLGSVGSVEAFEKKEDGTYEIAFVSKTLTDSGINTTISKEDIRGGTGAPIQFSFYHDPAVEINLTDVVFKPQYLEAQLGTVFTRGNPHGYASESHKSNETGAIELDYQPIPLNFGACGGEIDCVWASKKGEDRWRTYKLDKKGKTVSGFKPNTDYCVRYCKEDLDSLIARVTSNIIPSEFMLIITAPVFAGDACAASNGKKAGTITYEIPRFRLNGGSEMAFNMSSNQTMNLAGSAYATDDACEMGEQTLYNIVLTLDHYRAGRVYEDLIVDEDCLIPGGTPVVYGLTSDGEVLKIDNEDLRFDPPLVDGKFTADTQDTKYTITVVNREMVGPGLKPEIVLIPSVKEEGA